MPALSATNFATASIWGCVSLPLNAGMTPPPFSTWCCAIANDGFSWSRFGPIVPVAAAAASVWQLAQFAEKIDFPSVPCCAGGFAFVPADSSDEACDVDRVLAGHEALGHRRRREADLVEDDVLDRAQLEALALRAGEGLVEVRADGALRARGREHVAAGALRREERLAVRQVGARRGLAARAAATRDERGGSQQCPWKRAAQHYAGGWFPVVPSVATASSRVG